MVPTIQIYRFAGVATVRWRMVSANGRGIAQSVDAYDTPGQARGAIDEIRSGAAGLETVVRLTPDYRWHWSLRRGQELVVEGIGDQDRRVRCVSAATRFLDMLAASTVHDEVVVFRSIVRTLPGRRVGAGAAYAAAPVGAYVEGRFG